MACYKKVHTQFHGVKMAGMTLPGEKGGLERACEWG